MRCGRAEVSSNTPTRSESLPIALATYHRLCHRTRPLLRPVLLHRWRCLWRAISRISRVWTPEEGPGHHSE